MLTLIIVTAFASMEYTSALVTTTPTITPIIDTTSYPYFKCTTPPFTTLYSEVNNKNGTVSVVLTCSGSFDPSVALFKWWFKRNLMKYEKVQIDHGFRGGMKASRLQFQLDPKRAGQYKCEAQSDYCELWGKSKWVTIELTTAFPTTPPTTPNIPYTTTSPHYFCTDPPFTTIDFDVIKINGTGSVTLICSGSFDPSVALFKWWFKGNRTEDGEVRIEQDLRGGRRASKLQFQLNPERAGQYKCEAQSDNCELWGKSKWVTIG